MARNDGHHQLKENPPKDNNDGSHAPPDTTHSTTKAGHAPLYNHPGHGSHLRHSPRRGPHKLSG